MNKKDDVNVAETVEQIAADVVEVADADVALRYAQS